MPESWRKPFARYGLPQKVDRFDMLIVAGVTVLVVTTNLVYAVGVGLVLAAFRYAWESSQDFEIRSSGENGSKVYTVKGKLYFGTSMRFHTMFDYAGDPADVTLHLEAAPADYSATTALGKVVALYTKADKRVSIYYGEPSYVASPAPEASPGP